MGWRRAFLFLAGVSIAACDASVPPQADTLNPSEDRPQRIVSLDYCADQYVLKFADRDQILAVSPDAVKGFSYMREAADGSPTVRPRAEDVLLLKPDLVVRSYGGGPNAAAFFERAGVRVLQVGWASNVDGDDIGSIPSLIRHMAKGLGHAERGDALVDEFRERLAAISMHRNDETALYMTPGGVTTGPGSLVHDMLSTAGLENFETQPGWRSLPLERLAYEQPDIVAAAFFETHTNHPAAWSEAKHPIARDQLENRELVSLEGAWTACGGWFILDAIEALAGGDQ